MSQTHMCDGGEGNQNQQCKYIFAKEKYNHSEFSQGKLLAWIRKMNNFKLSALRTFNHKNILPTSITIFLLVVNLLFKRNAPFRECYHIQYRKQDKSLNRKWFVT